MATEEFKVRSLDEYTDAEKAEAFDGLYAYARKIYDGFEVQERQKDPEHFSYERLLTLLVPKDKSTDEFWKHFRKLEEMME